MGNCVSPNASQKQQNAWKHDHRKSTPLPYLDLKNVPKVRALGSNSEESSPILRDQNIQFRQWGSRTISSGTILGKFDATRSSSPSHFDDTRHSPSYSQGIYQEKTFRRSTSSSSSTQDFKNNFIFSKKLGQGHFGSVRLCYSKKDPNIKFAVKSMSIKDRSQHQEQIQSEIDALNHVDHPHIVKFFDCVEDKKFFHLVMEYVEGETLFQRILRDGPFAEDHAKRLIRQLVHAISQLHAQGIVHRDLKPENILFTDDTQQQIKLVDLGLSKHQTLDSIRSIVGTPLYIAPEVYKKHYDSKCDLWSIGVISYFLLSGSVPFIGDKPGDIYQQAKAGKIKFEGQSWKQVSDSAKNFIKSLLDVKVEKRPDTKKALTSSWLIESDKTQTSIDEVAQKIDDFKQLPKMQQIVLVLFGRFKPNSHLSGLIETYTYLDLEAVPFSLFVAALSKGKGFVNKKYTWTVFKQLAGETVITEEIMLEKLIDKFYLGMSMDDIKDAFREMSDNKQEVNFESFKNYLRVLQTDRY